MPRLCPSVGDLHRRHVPEAMPSIFRRLAAAHGLEPSTDSAPRNPSNRASTLSATINGVTVRFTPLTPPRHPRLKHVRDLWQMHRPQKPQAILTAAIFQTDTGRELRVGFSLTNLIHSALSRKVGGPLEARAEAAYLVARVGLDRTAHHGQPH
jgi:hypothetical protein